MGKGGYYLVTESGAPAVEGVPGGGKAAIVCERPGLAEEGETLEPMNFDDLAFLLEARADVGYVRVRAPGARGPSRSPASLEERFSDPTTGADGVPRGRKEVRAGV